MRFFDSVGRVDKRGSVIRSVSLPPEVAERAIRERCGGVKGKFSAYVSDLIAKDLKAGVPDISPDTEERLVAWLNEKMQSEYGLIPLAGRSAKKGGIARGS